MTKIRTAYRKLHRSNFLFFKNSSTAPHKFSSSKTDITKIQLSQQSLGFDKDQTELRACFISREILMKTDRMITTANLTLTVSKMMMRITIFILFISSYTLGFRPLSSISNERRSLVDNNLGLLSRNGLGLGADIDVDVAVIGGGIAGSSISWLLQERENCTVSLIDPRVDSPGTWYPNYGEWRAEWHHLSDRLQLPELKECTTTEWEITGI
jgi:hypothetical protein